MKEGSELWVQLFESECARIQQAVLGVRGGGVTPGVGTGVGTDVGTGVGAGVGTAAQNLKFFNLLKIDFNPIAY